jgi:hypothetical protein
MMLKIAIFAFADVIEATKALLQMILHIIKRNFATVGYVGDFSSGPFQTEAMYSDIQKGAFSDGTPRMSAKKVNNQNEAQ